MATTKTPPPPQRLLLVSVPRTASNLLLKIVNIHRQPHIHTNSKGGYFFYDAYVASTRNANLHRPIPEWTETEKAETRSNYQRCLDTLEEESKQAQQEGKVMFAKEHAFWFVNPAAMQTEHEQSLETFRLDVSSAGHGHGYGPGRTFSGLNSTVLPDEYLRTWRIAFIIRHPALAWPSMYRAMSKIAQLGLLDEDGVRGASVSNMTLRWTRRLFEWCREQPDEMTVPVVIDAHDIIHHPGSVLRFCEATGLDTGAVQMEWEDDNISAAAAAAAGAGAHQMDRNAAQIMLSTLEASKGIVKDKAPETVDIPAEAEKWRAEFGDEVAGLIEKAVWDAMPDYEYLKERRVLSPTE